MQGHLIAGGGNEGAGGAVSGHRGDPLVGIAARDIARTGVTRVGRLTDVHVGKPVCEGEAIDPRVIVWSTGFVPDYSWIDLPVLDAEGRPRHRRGIATDRAGLYFVGLRFQYRMTSALLGGVGADATYVAGRIAERTEEMDDAA